MEKIPNWECLFVHRKPRLFLSVHVDDVKMNGKKHNLAPTRKKMMKHVDLDERTSFLDHEILGCTQRECTVNQNGIDQYRENVQITNFCYRNWTNTRMGETSPTWKDMLKSALRDTIGAKNQLN